MAGDCQPAGTPEPVRRFIGTLGKLDRGELATLRRNAGRTLAESRDALGLFYRILPPAVAGGRDEEVYFLVATLYPLDDRSHTGDFGSTLKAVRATTNPDGVDRRMAVLLDSDFGQANGRQAGGELAYRLRQAVRLAAGHEVGVDWPRLLVDLIWWGHPERRVRKQWARSYYGQIEERPVDGDKATAGLDS